MGPDPGLSGSQDFNCRPPFLTPPATLLVNTQLFITVQPHVLQFQTENHTQSCGSATQVSDTITGQQLFRGYILATEAADEEGLRLKEFSHMDWLTGSHHTLLRVIFTWEEEDKAP